MRIKLIILLLSSLVLTSCSSDNNNNEEAPIFKEFIKGADLSFLPQIEESNIVFTDNEISSDALSILKNNGLNTVRIRLWHSPVNNHSAFKEVKTLSKRAKTIGLKVWLCVHYSDTWADPAHQEIPKAWKSLSFPILKDSVYTYTTKILSEIAPDYIQLGNEINPGFLLPSGDRFANQDQFKELLNSGIQAVRNNDNNCKIILHYAGHSTAFSFFNSINELDFDIMALSYYPLWHGKNLNELKTNLIQLSNQFNKPVVIAETAYPFTLNWNDWTNNIVGLEEQLILPDYPATPNGQLDFLLKVREICEETNALGFCYWGAEYVAFDGVESKNGSSWENQALFNFKNELLPAAEAFQLNIK